MTEATDPPNELTEAFTSGERERLRELFPEWNIWSSDAGSLMATRRRDLSMAELEAGLAMTLPSGVFGPPLVDQLKRQQEIEGTL